MLNFPLYCIKFVLFLPMCYISKMAEWKKKRKKKKRKEETIRYQFGKVEKDPRRKQKITKKERGWPRQKKIKLDIK